MSERRRKYRYDRILIESARILSPQFDAAVLYFTGAQIELLRNVTQYLRKLETYVAEYHPGYYLTPDESDYDDILAIVADLEETLMGNANVIFGYNDNLSERIYEDSDVNDDFTIETTQVPEGEMWRVLGMCMMRTSESPQWALPQATMDSVAIRLGDVYIENDYRTYYLNIDVLLNVADRLAVVFESAVIGESCRIWYWGYKMQVP